MAEMIRPFENGFFLSYDVFGEYGHSFGGPNGLANGDCPCCGKPLFLHLTLDMADPRLGWLSHRPRFLKLLYCMRCELCSDMFAYQLADDGVRIETIAANKGQTHFDAWGKHVGVEVFSHRQLDLRPVVQRYQALADRLNDDEELTEAEKEEFVRLAGNPPNWLPQSTNQVGGRPYVCAVQRYPLCPVCCPKGEDREKYKVFHQAKLPHYVQHLEPYAMTLVACIGNDPKARLCVSYPDATVMFYVCTTCAAIAVYHYVV